MIKLFKRLAIAFSLYSRIPMPIFDWNEDDAKHAITFLPLIGAVIGLVEVSIYQLSIICSLPQIAQIAAYSAIPLLVTGGFHVDGFMDVEDALKSYKSKEEKLEILKDPHIGAFSVIRLIILILFWIFGLTLLLESTKSCFYVFAAIFMIARAMAGLVALKLPHAKRDGMLNMETTKERCDMIALFFELLIGIIYIGCFDLKILCLLFVIEMIFTYVFKTKMEKNFGGVTGDTIGYFIVMSEVLLLTGLGSFGFSTNWIVWKIWM